MSEKLALIVRELNLIHGPTTVSFLLLDGSDSMNRFGQTPKTAIEGHIKTLQKQDDRQYLCGVVGFNDQPYVVVPLSPVGEITDVGRYSPSGMTLLYGTALLTLGQLLHHYVTKWQRIHDQLRVVVGVFSDGDDTASRAGSDELVRKLSAEALSYGWELMVFGIGIDAVRLAHKLGFPEDPTHAITVEATPQGVEESVISMTMSTMGGFHARDDS